MSHTRSMTRAARADQNPSENLTPGNESTSGFSSSSTRVNSEQIMPQTASTIGSKLDDSTSAHLQNLAAQVHQNQQQMDDLKQMMEQFMLEFNSSNNKDRPQNRSSQSHVGNPDADHPIHDTAEGNSDQPRNFRAASEPHNAYVTCENTEEDAVSICSSSTHNSRNEASLRYGPESPIPNYGAPRGDPVQPEIPSRFMMGTIPINQIAPPTFGGDRTLARSWLRQYEDTMNINGYCDDQKLTRARAYLTGEAQQWFNTRMRLDKYATWQTLKTSFLRHFCGTHGVDLLRKKLLETRQRHDEHPSSFLVRVVDLCQEYNPRMTDEQLVKRVASGLTDATFNTLAAVRDKEDWTIDWITQRFEQFKFSGGKHSTRDAPTDPKPKSTSTTALPKKPRDLSTWICANCSGTGHVVDDCKMPRDESRIKSKMAEFRAARIARNAKRMEKQHGDKQAEQRGVNALGAATLSKAVTAQHANALPCDQITKPNLTFNLNGREYSGRADTGADITVIPSYVADELQLKLFPWDEPALKAAGNSVLEVAGMASVLASYEQMKRPILVAVLSSRNFRQPLWGLDILQAFGFKLDLSKATNSADFRPTVNVEDHIRIQSAITIVDNSNQHPIDKVTFGQIDPQTRSHFERELLARANTFSRDDSDIGRTSTIKHRIHLIDDKPVHSGPFRTPLRNQKAMSEAIERLRSSGAIRESKSPYAAPVFFVDKDHGKGQRLVADYRALNTKTIPDRQPMPHPEEVFSLLAGTKIYAKLDITAMFNQIEVDELDVEKTAITTSFGLFECPLMPFGLKNAPATAVRLMREVLRDLNGRTCFVYFDDIIVYAANVCELMQRCITVLDKIHQHGLKLKPTKCVFAVDSVKFLGHQISARGIEIDAARIEHVMKFPVPRNPSDVRSFHGLCSYNRKFIRNFAEIAKPLTSLTGKPSDFHWNLEAQQSFETLRRALVSAPVLVHFNPDADHELRTDASSIAIGAVLYQKHQDSEQTGVVLYFSKSLSSAQRNYSATERELLAVFLSVTELQHYLFGKRFTLITDHAALSLLKNGKDPHKRLARWVAQLQSFEFDVVYKKGSNHVDADCMSRFVPELELEDTAPMDPEGLIRSICQVASQDPESQQAPSQLEVDSEIDIRAEQREDSFCKKFIDILESTTLSDRDKARQARNFTMQNGLLYRIRFGDTFLLVVPPRRRAAILISCHDVPLAGHLGFSRTYGIIKCRYYWPKMRREIKKYVASCLACQRRKAPNTRKQGLTRPLPIAENVFDSVGIDLLSKLPRSHNGFNTILVCTDNLSKYVITVPLKDELAETVMHAFFNHVVSKHGCPRQVLSDNGSNLIGERSRDFYRLFGIKRLTTSAYHPQTNGQTERFNRTLATSLTLYVERNQKDWPDFIQAITFAYNISEHSVTRVSPFEMVFGKKPRLPIDNLLDVSEFIDPSGPIPGSLSSAAINKLRQLVLKNQQKNKRRLDSRLAPSSFKEGDLVLVERPTHTPGAANKLTYTYLGPYKIVRKISDLSFEIGFPRQRQGGSIVHPCHLRKFVPRDNVVIDDLIQPDFIPRSEVLSLEPEEQRVAPDACSQHSDDSLEDDELVTASMYDNEGTEITL